ncbi:MAG: NAD(P)/FAD-dependent oxidoreductase [Lachnospiraceae bacterium]|nr:NAD(P)/FAD-dependent oxidoreductase [Lachnospiraceae bacterium]
MYDVAIIGSGPAGLSAALNLKLHNKNTLWFGSPELSAKVEKSELIANYPGIPMVTGADLNRRFRQQIEDMGLVLTDKMVTNISSTRKGFMILGDNDIFDAKAIILATGAVSPKGLPGEHELLGHGVSLCATCDGFLYPGKTIAVFCGSQRFEHEVAYLAGIAEKVYLYTTYADCQVDLPNVIRLTQPMAEICGENRVSSIRLKDGEELPADGVFMLRPAVAAATLLKGLETDGPHIVADRQCRTNTPGCFAAGDCTGRPYQLTKAMGEGNIAAHSVLDYLAEMEKDH